MTEVALRLKDEILRLPPEERIEIARAVWDSLDEKTVEELEEAEWIAELNRRAEDLAAGRAIAEPADQVMAELRAELLRENERR
jgi:putative addiction module component (TIGR02574 family)